MLRARHAAAPGRPRLTAAGGQKRTGTHARWRGGLARLVVAGPASGSSGASSKVGRRIAQRGEEVESLSEGRLHTCVDFHRSVDHLIFMNASELRRLLAKQGCTFETHKGGSGHLTVRRGEKTSQLPMHGGNKEL